MQDWMGDWMDRMEFLEPGGRIYAGPRVRSTHPVQGLVLVALGPLGHVAAPRKMAPRTGRSF